jgi:CBS domain containing-hemolysin-like protein
MSDLVIAVSLLLIFSALASGTEAALFAIPKSKVLSFLEEDRYGASSLMRIKEDMARPIMAIVIVNNMANIVGSMIVGALAAKYFEGESIGPLSIIGIFSALLTFAVITFSEIIPKTIGERKHELIALSTAPMVLNSSRLMLPFIFCIELITKPILSMVKEGEHGTSEAEIRALSEIGSQTGAIEQDELEMIHRVFELNDVKSWDIMTPLAKVDALDGRRSLNDIKEEVFALTHTRLPVHEGSFNKVIGVVHLRDILQALVSGRGDMPVSTIAKDPSYILDSASGNALLQHFQQTKQHLAIVVDALGTVLGVLTLEDVLEELVGEIHDETDVEQVEVQQLSEDTVLALAEAHTDVVGDLLGLSLPDARVGEMIVASLERIPVEGEVFIMHGLEVTIVESTPRAVRRLSLRRLTQDEIPDPDTETANGAKIIETSK